MEESLSDNIMLHQRKAERMFAGAVWMNDDYARQTCGWLKPDTFLDKRLGKFWELVLSGSNGNDAAVSAQAYNEVMDCLTQIATGRDAPAFADAIALDVYLRSVSQNAGEIARSVLDRDVTKVKRLAQSIVEGSPAVGQTLITSIDVGWEFIAALDDITGRSEKTGITNLDYATGGLEKPSMTILAARPSMGKSSLAIQIARFKAEIEKKRVGFFSLEMNRINIWARMACGDLGIAWRDVRAGRARPEDIQRLRDKSSDLIDAMEDRLVIDDRANMSIDDIWRVVSGANLDMVIIDHLGLVSSTEKDEVKSLGDISRMGKVMSKEFDIPVMFLYQMNRNNEYENKGSSRRRPTMSDIRGSGKIEENADNILFLYRPDYYDEAAANASKVSDAEIIVAKFREGVRNIQVKVKYHLDEQKFYPETLPGVK